MEKLKNISVRVDSETIAKVNKLSELEKEDKSIIYRKALDKGLKEIIIDIAVKEFAEDKISYGEAAKLTDMYIGDFMELVARRGVAVKPYTYDIKNHLDKSEKHLFQILSTPSRGKIRCNSKKK